MLGIEGEDHYMDALLAMLEGLKPAAPAVQPAPHVAPVVSINPPQIAAAVADGVQAPREPATVKQAVATVDAFTAGKPVSDEEIGRVVRFLFGR